MKKNNNILNKFNFYMGYMDIIKFSLVEFIIERNKGFERIASVIGYLRYWKLQPYYLVLGIEHGLQIKNIIR